MGRPSMVGLISRTCVMGELVFKIMSLARRLPIFHRLNRGSSCVTRLRNV